MLCVPAELKETGSPWKIVRQRTAAAVIAALVIAVVGSYLLWAFVTGNQPSCSGYPPGGNCPGEYSYTFNVSVSYPGQWSTEYYGYHSVGNPNGGAFSSSGSYTHVNFTATGDSLYPVTLTGPNDNGLTLCALAQKLDSSNSSLTIAIQDFSNSTNVPYGSAYACAGVAP
jgi:hypothetical protein